MPKLFVSRRHDLCIVTDQNSMPSSQTTSTTDSSFYWIPCWVSEVVSWITKPSATGGSAIKAIEVLLGHGVKEEKILFLNLVSASVFEVCT